MKTLDLLFNNLEGAIPDVLTEMPNLVVFDVEQNRLVGPAFVNLTGLTALESYRVSFNELTGHMPSEIFTDLPALRELFAANNTLVGSIPGEIGEAANLGTSRDNNGMLILHIDCYSLHCLFYQRLSSSIRMT